MNTEKFTTKSMESLEMAQKMAIKLNHPEIDSIHIHYGLLEEEQGLVSSVLQF